jgi:phytol kinase
MLVSLWKPVRVRVQVFQTMFSSFDRPEDRPHTLLWLTTQIIAGYMVLIPMSMLFARYGMAELAFIPVIIHGLGDGLAEPVGIRFGRHKYSTRTFMSRARRHTRSYEGSACVLIVGILAVAGFHHSFTTAQFIVALLTVPILTTLAEAWSPHTWDTPYMFLVCGATLLSVKLLI